MLRKDRFFRTAVSAAIMSFAAGAALAAGPQPGLFDQYAQASQRSTGSGGGPDAGKTMQAPATPRASLNAKEGMDVVNTKGRKIGEVSRIEGEKIIVEIGGFLGIGSREVALDRNQLQKAGSGDNARLQTTMTEKQLEALPKYESPTKRPRGTVPKPDGGAQRPSR